MILILDENGDYHKAELPVEGTFLHLCKGTRNDCIYRKLSFDSISFDPSASFCSILVPYDRVGLKFLHDIIKQRPDIEDREGLHKLYDLIMATLLDVVDDFKAVSGEFWYV